MRLLNVNGLGDYAATYFEKIFKKDIDRAQLWDDVWDSENHSKEVTMPYEEYGDRFEMTFLLKAYKFGDVDKDFVRFVRDEVQDYDFAKSENFYIIGKW